MAKVTRATLVLTLLSTLLLLGCGPAAPSLPTQVAREIAAGLEATLTAQPAATAYATAPPPATQAPLPTGTPPATATPQPTQPPPATATPYPTQTAWPTFTPTATPTVTNTPRPVTPAPPAPPGGTNLDDQLLATLFATLNDVRLFRQLVTEGYNSGVVNCNGIIAAFNRVVNAPTYDVSSGSPEAQYAYAVYREAITRFSGESDEPWTNGAYAAYENCVNNGAMTIMTQQHNNDASLACGGADHRLVLGIQRLGGEV